MTYHTKSSPRLSGSILYTLISVFSLTLITACGGGGLKLDANLNITDGRLATLCGLNPFVTACADFADERKSFIDRCVADDETVADGLCATATTFVCEDNPFPILCDKEEKYRDAQQVIVVACEAGTCDDAQIVQFCEDNPYHARCIGETAYDTTRDAILATCGTATRHEHCHTAVVPVCMDNPFDIVCYADTTYEDARVDAIVICSGGFIAITNQRCVNAIAVTCVGDGIADNPGLCEEDSTVSTACGLNIFNTVCDNSENYLEERREFCADPATASDDRCPDVVSSTCTDNPFHALCLTGNTYDTPRATAITDCITVPQGALCEDAITHACTDNPFHALCSGASAATYNSARQTAVTECGDGTNVITTQLCIDAVALTCEGDSADIFHVACIAAAAQTAQVAACGANPPADSRCYLAEQINACAEGLETDRCAAVSTNADIMTCIVDPFATDCVDDSGFDAYLTAAQGIRYTYCSADGRSATDPLCASYRACDTAFMGNDPVPAGCGNNFSTVLRDGCVVSDAGFLFSTQCDGGRFDTQRSDFCGTNEGGVNNLFHASCTAEYQDATARNTFCMADPFHASCKGNAAYATEREDLCKTATPHASCVTPLLSTVATEPVLIPPETGRFAPPPILVRYADSFLSVRIKSDGPKAPIFEPIVQTIVTPESTNSETGVVTPQSSTTVTVPIGELSINVGRRGGAGTNDAPNANPDGYVFFTLIKAGTAPIAQRTSQHAAILPTTNLGAPLTEAPVTAVWPGHFSTTEAANRKQQAVDFFIKFNPATGGGEINFSNDAGDDFGLHVANNRPEGRPSIATASQLRLSVHFNAKGQIVNSFAEIRDATTNQGLLRVIGFIGQEGVVAAFVDRNNTGKLDAGGFTASNPDHRDYTPAAVAEDLSLTETDDDSNLNLVNYEDWLDSSVAPSYDRTAPRQSEFLQTNNRRIPGLVNGHNAVVADFNSITNFRSVLAKGDAINGFAVHTEAGNHYAGVFNTASLGAPIDVAGLTAQNVPSALWRGYLVAQDGTATTGRLFDLTVNFTTAHEGQAGELKGTVRNNIVSLNSGLLYTIDGRFNPRGVISGIIRRTTAEGLINAPLSGIIGRIGAIGVFASNEENNKFAGGFVAVPYQVPTAVAYSNVWKATHDGGVYGLGDVPRAENHWLEGGKAGTNGQSVAGITGYNGGLLRMSTATWKLGSIGTDVNDAVAFYTGIYKGRRQFYAGVTSGTDLGKPVQSKSGKGTWYGQLSARQNVGTSAAPVIETRYGDITLEVFYNQTGGSINGSLPANGATSRDYTYEIRGRFNEDGFVSGGVDTIKTGGAREDGYLSGLIGQGGIVGAFVAPNFSGGFVARTSKPNFASTKTTYQDWAHFAGNRFGTLRDRPYNEAGLRNAFLHTNPNGHNINWGDIGQDAGQEHTGRGAVSVAEALGQSNLNLVPPAALKGGYSWLAGYWDRPSLHQAEGVTSLNRGYHAGLFQNIDVGLPLGATSRETGSATAYWNGHFYAHQNKTFADSKNTSASIRLLINYGNNREISTSYSTVDGNRIGGIYTISGPDGQGNMVWDERGVIHGRIHHKESHIPSGSVTGLIGREGLIAVFVSDPDTGTKPHYGYAGGFIACPTLSTAQNSGCIR